ncbi:hypothetical protein [Undibacterium sp. TJN19]|uniref:hypothetical protein n=1 Tax=Undibacterium sp. TJN19 TaxID=3413055 RepID=UPI003BF145B0
MDISPITLAAVSAVEITPAANIQTNSSAIDALTLPGAGGLNGQASIVDVSTMGQILAATITLLEQQKTNNDAASSKIAAQDNASISNDVANKKLNDFSNIATAAQLFVNAFNTFQDANNDGLQNPLSASFENSLQQAIDKQTDSDTGQTLTASLAQIGIGTQSAVLTGASENSGQIAVDLPALQTAFNTDPAQTLSVVTQALQSLAQVETSFLSQDLSANPADVVSATVPTATTLAVTPTAYNLPLATTAANDQAATAVTTQTGTNTGVQVNPENPAPAAEIINANATLQAELSDEALQAAIEASQTATVDSNKDLANQAATPPDATVTEETQAGILPTVSATPDVAAASTDNTSAAVENQVDVNASAINEATSGDTTAVQASLFPDTTNTTDATNTGASTDLNQAGAQTANPDLTDAAKLQAAADEAAQNAQTIQNTAAKSAIDTQAQLTNDVLNTIALANASANAEQQANALTTNAANAASFANAIETEATNAAVVANSLTANASNSNGSNTSNTAQSTQQATTAAEENAQNSATVVATNSVATNAVNTPAQTEGPEEIVPSPQNPVISASNTTTVTTDTSATDNSNTQAQLTNQQLWLPFAISNPANNPAIAAAVAAYRMGDSIFHTSTENTGDDSTEEVPDVDAVDRVEAVALDPHDQSDNQSRNEAAYEAAHLQDQNQAGSTYPRLRTQPTPVDVRV